MDPDLLPDEADAMRRYLEVRTRSAVVFVLLCIGVLGFLVFHGVTNQDARQLVLGQGEHLRAEVVDKAFFAGCRRRDKVSYTVRWTVEGEPRTAETVRRCSDPHDVGDVIDVWSTDGAVYSTSPTNRRLWVGGAFLASVTLGGLVARSGHRLHVLVHSVLSGEPMAGPFPVTGNVHTGAWHVQLDAGARNSTYDIAKRKAVAVTPATTQARRAGAPRGQLLVSELRDGKPRGFGLFLGDDGSRTWRLIG